MPLHVFEVLRRPLVTEKSTILQDKYGKYAFEIDYRANKSQVRLAVERSFNVKVKDVNIINMIGKNKRYGTRYTRRPSWKKAVVTLGSGDRIQLFEGT